MFIREREILTNSINYARFIGHYTITRIASGSGIPPHCINNFLYSGTLGDENVDKLREYLTRENWWKEELSPEERSFINAEINKRKRTKTEKSSESKEEEEFPDDFVPGNMPEPEPEPVVEERVIKPSTPTPTPTKIKGFREELDMLIDRYKYNDKIGRLDKILVNWIEKCVETYRLMSINF